MTQPASVFPEFLSATSLIVKAISSSVAIVLVLNRCATQYLPHDCKMVILVVLMCKRLAHSRQKNVYFFMSEKCRAQCFQFVNFRRILTTEHVNHPRCNRISVNSRFFGSCPRMYEKSMCNISARCL